MPIIWKTQMTGIQRFAFNRLKKRLGSLSQAQKKDIFFTLGFHPKLVRGCLPLRPWFMFLIIEIFYRQRKVALLFHACYPASILSMAVGLRVYTLSSLAKWQANPHQQLLQISFFPLFHRVDFFAAVRCCRKVHHPFCIFFLGDDSVVQFVSAELPFRKKFIQQMIMKLNCRLRISKFIGNGNNGKIVGVNFLRFLLQIKKQMNESFRIFKWGIFQRVDIPE